MRIFLNRFLGISLVLLAFLLPIERSEASYDFDLLDQAHDNGDPFYKRGASAILQALTFCHNLPQSRPKLPGRFQPYIEGAFLTTDVDDEEIFRFTKNSHAPNSYLTLALRGGLGLPYGFSVELALSQVVSEHKSFAISGVGSVQLLDLSTEVITDLVPSGTLSVSATRTFYGAAHYAFAGQLALGGYHRQWLAQAAYILQFNFGILTAKSSEFTEFIFRHGLATSIPIYERLFLKNEFLMLPLSASATLGWAF